MFSKICDLDRRLELCPWGRPMKVRRSRRPAQNSSLLEKPTTNHSPVWQCCSLFRQLFSGIFIIYFELKHSYCKPPKQWPFECRLWAPIPLWGPKRAVPSDSSSARFQQLPICDLCMRLEQERLMLTQCLDSTFCLPPTGREPNEPEGTNRRCNPPCPAVGHTTRNRLQQIIWLFEFLEDKKEADH